MRSFLLLLLIACPSWAAPPKLTIPAEVRPAGQYVDFVPDTDAVSVTYVGLDGIDPVPSRRLAEKTAFLLDCYGKPEKRYRFAAVASSATGEQSRADFVVVVGTPPVTDPPTKPTDPPTKPTDPLPPPKPTSLYFLIARKDGPADPAYTKTMSLPAWDELRAAGHVVKDKTLAEAKALGWGVPDGTVIPAVLTLQNNPDGKTMKQVRPYVALPTADDTIRALPAVK